MSSKKWNTEWKRLKRKSDKNLNLLATEEYLEDIAKRSAYYDFNKNCNKYRNKSQQYVPKDHYTDLTFYNNLKKNEYCNDYDRKSDQFTQEDTEETQSPVEITDTLYECFAFNEKRESRHEIYDASIITAINKENSLECQESQNENYCFSNNIIVSTDNTLNEKKTNVTNIVGYCESTADSDLKLVKDLGIWAVKRNITLNALSHLLKILRKYNHNFLPMCAQTLLKTPRNTISLIRKFESGGQFWYYGILSGLQTVLSKKILETMSDIIEIDVFFDGFSPYNSIRRCLWPIAGCIAGRNEVFIIAIWCGETKCPLDLDMYLEDFINESLEIMNGFNIEDRYYKLKIRNIIADAPARAWLKCVNQHGSKFACERTCKKRRLYRSTLNLSSEINIM